MSPLNPWEATDGVMPLQPAHEAEPQPLRPLDPRAEVVRACFYCGQTFTTRAACRVVPQPGIPRSLREIERVYTCPAPACGRKEDLRQDTVVNEILRRDSRGGA